MKVKHGRHLEPRLVPCGGDTFGVMVGSFAGFFSTWGSLNNMYMSQSRKV